MQKKRSIKIISIVLILVLICVSITYVKSGNKEVIATTKEFNTENLQDNEHMHIEVDSSGDKVPVPNGYVGSKVAGENEIDTGYVIYEGEEEVNDSNVEEAQKTRNQYVWIPVPDASTMYGTDANGKKWGKLYTFTTDSGDNIDPVTGTKPSGWKEENGIMQLNENTNYKEPYLAIDFENNSKLKSLDITAQNSHDFLIQLEKEFNTMIESIEKYKGFYIGRYETGDLSKEAFVVKKGNTDITLKSWFSAYKKCKELNNNNEEVTTGMLWGCQWDRTLMWLIESGNKSKEEICVDSTKWGNCSIIELEYINSNGDKVIKKIGDSSLIPTGSSEIAKANNIYDLSGNKLEQVLTSGKDNWSKQYSRTYVGTFNSTSYGIKAVNYRYKVAPNVSNGGCRAMLYIK